MYKCQKCGKVTKPHEKLNRLVTQTREKTYVNKFIDRYGNECEKITTGNEIVKEINVCGKCFEEVMNNEKV